MWSFQSFNDFLYAFEHTCDIYSCSLSLFSTPPILFTMLLYVLGICLATLIYIVLKRRYTYWTKRGVPQYKFWDIWLKNIIEVIRQPPLTDAMLKLYSDFADNRYVGIYQLFVPRLCVKDPDLIKQIFVKDFDHFVDHTMFIPTDGDPIWEKSLFSLTGDKWRQMRAIASPSFTSSKMKIMFAHMVECAEQFLEYVEQQGSDMATLEMKDLFGRLTSDVFFSTHFGVRCDSLKDPRNEFYLMGQRGADFGGFWIKLRFVLIQMCPRVTKMFGLKVFDQTVNAFFKKLVRQNIQERERNGIVRPDLMHLLMETKNGKMKDDGHKNGVIDSGFAVVKEASGTHEKRKDHSQLTDIDMTALAMAFFGGGFDSTSTLLAFVAYELALHPDIQEILQSEVDDTLEECEGAITYEALMNMKYLDMVVSETLRKWPGGFFLDRRCVKPYTINPIKEGEKPIHFEEGDSIWLPLFALQRDSELYPDPDRFDPERFSNENKGDINPYAYMPFGMGPRHCIGNRFALLETKTVIFHVLSKFSFTVVEKTAVPLRLARRNFQLTSKDGFWLGLKRRSKI